MIIAVDAAGGEYAPHEVVKGAIKAAHEYGVQITLVGRKEILYVQAGKHLSKLNMNIVDASQIIDSRESPVEAVTKKPDSSIVVGTNLVKEGTADAFVSAHLADFPTPITIEAAPLPGGRVEFSVSVKLPSGYVTFVVCMAGTMPVSVSV